MRESPREDQFSPAVPPPLPPVSRAQSGPLTHCEDCGAELHGKFCSNCGQVAIDYRRSFRHILTDAADSFLNWDSRFFGTFALLLVRPGWLTNQFLQGRRTRFLHPLRLYLLVSVLFFLFARLVPVQLGPVKEAQDLTPKERAAVAETMKNLPDLPLGAQEEIRSAMAKSAGLPAPTPAATSPSPAPKSEVQLADEAKASRLPPFLRWLKLRAQRKIGPHGVNARLVFETFRANLSTMMLCCIPLFAALLKLLYLRQRRFYIEHFVYALHIHGFFYIAVLLTALLAMAADRWAPAFSTPIIWLGVFAVLTQVILSIRQVYRQSWPMTAAKFVFGGMIYAVVLVLAFVTTALATVALP